MNEMFLRNTINLMLYMRGQTQGKKAPPVPEPNSVLPSMDDFVTSENKLK